MLFICVEVEYVRQGLRPSALKQTAIETQGNLIYNESNPELDNKYIGHTVLYRCNNWAINLTLEFSVTKVKRRNVLVTILLHCVNSVIKIITTQCLQNQRPIKVV